MAERDRVVSAYVHPGGEIVEVVTESGRIWQYRGVRWEPVAPPIPQPEGGDADERAGHVTIPKPAVSSPEADAGSGDTTVVYLPVCDETSKGGAWPLAWCDLKRAWADGDKWKAKISHAPEEYDRDCVTRIYPRIAPAGEWHPTAVLDWEDPYLPPRTEINGRPVVSVEPYWYDVHPAWRVELGREDASASGEEWIGSERVTQHPPIGTPTQSEGDDGE